MNIDKSYFLALFDEFSKTSTEKIDAYIDIATLRVPAAIWGNKVKYATALLVAHMLTTSGRQGDGSAGGAVTNEQVGDLSRAFATMFDTERGDALLLTTRYGIDFVQLRKETIVTAGLTGFRPFCPPPGSCW